jgi:GTPase SAR1 family protein
LWDDCEGPVVTAVSCARRSTYQNLSTWLSDARRHLTNPNTVIMLVGNKTDLAKQRQVRSMNPDTKCKDDPALSLGR